MVVTAAVRLAITILVGLLYLNVFLVKLLLVIVVVVACSDGGGGGVDRVLVVMVE